MTRLLFFVAFLLGTIMPAFAKAPICGLVTMGHPDYRKKNKPREDVLTEADTHPGVYKGVVIDALWSDIEPAPGHYDTSSIDVALASIQTYNSHYPQHRVVGKLRLFAGINAPAWVMNLSGPPLHLSKEAGGGPVLVGRFWYPDYVAAWRGLQAYLAHRYDANPLMGEVAMASCSTADTEVFLLKIGEDGMSPEWQQAGYSNEKHEACLMDAIQDYSVWKQTAVNFPIGMFHDQFAGRRRQADPGVSERVMEAWRRARGPLLVTGNQVLRPDLGPSERIMFAELKKLGPPTEFQIGTRQIRSQDLLTASMNLGLHTYNATEVELEDSVQAGGPANVTAGMLAGFASEFECRQR